MRQTTKTLAVAVLAVAACWTSTSQAAFVSYPRALEVQLNRISFEKPALAPMAHTVFCLRYKNDCEVRGGNFRKHNMEMTVDRLNELNSVNRQVNRDIIPQVYSGNLVDEPWIVSPAAGDCNDFAVTKRHELLAQGWPSRALLLSEVVVADGEHHLVLVVGMKDPNHAERAVDLVLDNLNYNLRPIQQTPYRWVRMESPDNPKFWSAVSVPFSSHPATLAD
jgi:predicted transglutaminase-like cysteine proteinase